MRAFDPARMYDYALGGKNHYAVERQAALQLLEVIPDAGRVARENRAFLTRAVRIMADSGIGQFLDLGCGFPTTPAIHEMAAEVNPAARVVYVDRDPVVLTHTKALVATDERTAVAAGDLTVPDETLRAAVGTGLLDLAQPLGVLLGAVLDLMDDGLAPLVMRRYRRALAVGSMIAISCVSSQDADPRVSATVQRVYDAANVRVTFRSQAQTEALLDGWAILEPGVVDITRWRQEGGRPGTLRVSGVVGLKA